MKHTYNAGGVDKTVHIDQLVLQLQSAYNSGLDTFMAVNTLQNGRYLRLDGYYMGLLPVKDTFDFQDKATGDYYTVRFTEIVRTY